ncbi:hypothetical protein MKP05_09610 [Halomonas sp. EGI 63088]|uniref:Uncharacterized protein n=1 Tax=Halomonas flagellata TaxID=2920385 RepID=A0ABS9RU96_9GAMM|nr:hypothetical protein [Halomonas flagellata]MCH4563385.1 hypothetical protein [Halomonas flagellata]
MAWRSPAGKACGRLPARGGDETLAAILGDDMGCASTQLGAAGSFQVFVEPVQEQNQALTLALQQAMDASE